MKTFDSSNDSNESNGCNDTITEAADKLIDSERAHGLLKCNPYLVLSYDVLKKTPHELKDRFYQRVLSKNNVIQDLRTQSLPNCLDEENNSEYNIDIPDSCDTKLILRDDNSQSQANDLWFKTWPEKRCDKPKTESNSNDSSPSKNININSNGVKPPNKLTFNDALQNISLAYSPLTKQLHLIENPKPVKDDVLNESRIKGHRRNEPGSFSSTISSLSDPSSSGSLLESEDQSIGFNDDEKSKRKGLTNFFNRNVFSWKSPTLNSINGASNVWRFFGKPSNDVAIQSSPQHEQVVASSSALIQHNRPSNLPAKTLEEEQRHRQEYEAILAAAKKKDAQSTVAKQKQQKLQLKLEEQQANATKHFTQNVLPKWETMHNTRKTRDLWWQGLPSSVRGKVWRLAIGNELNLTSQLYDICLSRAQNRLSSPELLSHHSDSDIDQEGSMDVIQLDIARTFPHLGIFQEGGPYSDVLHSLLAAYVCYRPDVGYVQGMSYIAAILILNMDQYDAFVCFANLLNRPLHVAAFTLNQIQMRAYYDAYDQIFSKNLPRLHSHFEDASLTPDLYLLDWIYTIFAKAMQLDVACRVWDLFLRDGDEFIFRTALGILHLNQDILLTMDFLHGAQFLIRLPDDLSTEQLFKSIQSVSTNIGKLTFNIIVEKCKNNMYDDTQ